MSDNANEEFRLAFVGAGTHANNMLYPALSFIDDVAIRRVAVCDLDQIKAEKISRSYGVERVYTDHRKLFDKEKLDGVVVCINAQVHPTIVRDALEAGVDVFVEKPVSITVEETEELRKLAEAKNRIVMVDHQKRRSSAYRKALEITGSSKFGAVTMIASKMHGHLYDNLFNCMMEWQIHNIDIVRAFAGDVSNVEARMHRLAPNRATIAMLVEFENGAVGTLNWGSEAGWGRFCERLEIVGSNGEAVVVDNVRHLTHYREDESWEWGPNWIPISENQTTVIDGYVGNLRAFIESVRTRVPAVPGLADEVAALKFIYAVADKLGIETEWTMTIGKR